MVEVLKHLHSEENTRVLLRVYEGKWGEGERKGIPVNVNEDAVTMGVITTETSGVDMHRLTSILGTRTWKTRL